MTFQCNKNGVDYVFGPMSVSPWLVDNFATWEPETFSVFEEMRMPDGIALDLGAWIGTTSVWLSKNFKKVVSVECDPISVRCLEDTLNLSGCKNVEIIPKPISNKNKTVIFGPRKSTWNESMSCIKDGQTNQFDIEMDTITLKDIPYKFDFIKCDIEGGEEDILEDLLTYGCPVYVSFHRDWWKSRDLSRFNDLFSRFNVDAMSRVSNDGFCSILFRKKCLTNAIHVWEGIGSQYLTIIRAILFSEIHGYEYVYTEPDWKLVYSKEEASAINNMMNIASGYRIADKNTEILDRSTTYKFVDGNMDACANSPTMDNVKRLFFSNTVNPFKSGFHAVIHIRRPSVNVNIDLPEFYGNLDVKSLTDFSHDLTERYTADGYFLNQIKDIRERHPDAIIHIVSDGKPEFFEKFRMDGVILHINEPVVDTFMMMVYADILVTSKSTFSYIAAMFNKNEVRYLQCFHPPASHWISS
jgi:FkbM family methyltransferase